MAGFRELLAIEWGSNAAATFRLNFPDVPIWEKDICSIAVGEVLRFCGIAIGELDVLDGSPPCQGFSLAGRQEVTDSRNNLYKQFVRLLSGLEPKVFVMENVGNIVRGRIKGMFKEIMASFADAGYKTKCRLMDSQWQGVPQRRKRLIWIGIRKDLGIEPTYPIPRTAPVTVRQAFRGLPLQLQAIELPEREKKLWHATKRGNNLSDAALRLFGQKNCNFTHWRLAWDKPCPTICASIGSAILHSDECRLLTIAELKRLQSFPDWFRLEGSYSRQWLLIGNSVPPLLMKAIAEHIKDNILNYTSKKAVKLDG